MKKNNIDEFIVFREIPIALGRVIVLLFGIFVVKLNSAFILTALGYIFYFFL